MNLELRYSSKTNVSFLKIVVPAKAAEIIPSEPIRYCQAKSGQVLWDSVKMQSRQSFRDGRGTQYPTFDLKIENYKMAMRICRNVKAE